jgi:hypothetical protein
MQNGDSNQMCDANQRVSLEERSRRRSSQVARSYLRAHHNTVPRSSDCDCWTDSFSNSDRRSATRARHRPPNQRIALAGFLRADDHADISRRSPGRFSRHHRRYPRMTTAVLDRLLVEPNSKRNERSWQTTWAYGVDSSFRSVGQEIILTSVILVNFGDTLGNIT